MKRIDLIILRTIVLFWTCALPLTAVATPIEEYYFSKDATYPVNTALGVVTQIELSPKEVIKDFGAGLSSGWELVRRDNVFYVKPKDKGVDTNLIVRTEAHNYIFELKVVSSNWKTLGDMKNQGVNYKVRFNYPEDTDFNVKHVQTAGYDLSFDPDKFYNTNYDVSYNESSSWLVPLKVYDDANFTYIFLRPDPKLPTGSFPSVYGRKTSNSEDMVVNTNVDGNVIVVHGTYQILVIRHGENIVGLRRN